MNPPCHRYIRLRLANGATVEQVVHECCSLFEFPGTGNQAQLTVLVQELQQELPSNVLPDNVVFIKAPKKPSKKKDTLRAAYLAQHRIAPYVANAGRDLLAKVLQCWQLVPLREYLCASTLSGESPEATANRCPPHLSGSWVTAPVVQAFSDLLWDFSGLTLDAKINVLRASGSYRSMETALTAGADAWMFSAGLTSAVNTSEMDQTRVIRDVMFVKLARNRGTDRDDAAAMSNYYKVWAHSSLRLKELEAEASAKARDAASLLRFGAEGVTLDGDALAQNTQRPSHEVGIPILRADAPSVCFSELLVEVDRKNCLQRITDLEQERTIGPLKAAELRASVDAGNLDAVFGLLDLLANRASGA